MRGALLHIRNLLRDTPNVDRIRAMLPAVHHTLEKIREDPTTGRPEQLSWQRLTDAEALWERHKVQLDTWQATLQDRVRWVGVTPSAAA